MSILQKIADIEAEVRTPLTARGLPSMACNGRDRGRECSQG